LQLIESGDRIQRRQRAVAAKIERTASITA
jgi:hypothetical protein